MFDPRFRWVELQLSLFFDPRTPLHHPESIKIKIQSLKDGSIAGQELLNSTYQDIFDRNTHEGFIERTHADLVLSFILCAFEKPTFGLLIQLVSRSHGEVDGTVDREYLLKICRNVITSNANGDVELADISVKDFLRTWSAKKQWNQNVLEALFQCFQRGLPQSFYLDVKLSQELEGTGPQLYVVYHDPYKVLLGHRFQSLGDTFGFYVYLCAYWTEHFRASNVSRAEELFVKLSQTEKWRLYCHGMIQFQELLGTSRRIYRHWIV
jgi:hypothetical protein